MTRLGSSLPFPLDIDRRRRTPLVRQIVDAIAQAVRTGRLAKNDRLPGARSLARALEVDRSTVDAAFVELETQGVLEIVPRSGARVRADVPQALVFPSHPSARAHAGFPVYSALRRAATALRDDDDEHERRAIALWGGSPDVSLMPARALSRALREVLLGRRARRRLSYGDAAGEPTLRAALACMLRETRALSVEADDILVTRGSQMALDLCARTLVSAGDVIVVENPGYPPMRAAFAERGARLMPVRVDAYGLDVPALAQLLRTVRVRAVVVTPHHQYPTTATLSLERRLQLLELAARHRFCIVEDDYDHEFHYDGSPIAPLRAQDRAGVVVTIGTLSKILAPGLRVGWVTGPRDVVRALTAARHTIDRQGDHVLEAAVAILLEDGEIARHARRMRRVYRARRDALVEALQQTLGDVIDVRVPRGGMALWLAVRPPIDVDAWIEAMRIEGVILQRTRELFANGRGASRRSLRVGFAANDELTLRRAVTRMKRALERLEGSTRESARASRPRE